MVSGKQVICTDRCRICIPDAIDSMRQSMKYFDYFQCLNLPDATFGTGLASGGLEEIANAIRDAADQA